MNFLADIFAQMVGEALIDGASNEDRAMLTLACGAALFALIAESLLVVRNGWMPLPTWSEGAFAGLMFTTLTAVMPVAFGMVVLFRTFHKLLAVACLLVG